MISFNDNTISGGEFFNNSTISGNNINKSTVNIASEIDYNQLKELLCSAFANAQNMQEKECASQAAQLCSNDKKSLKAYIIDNISTFACGTFATTAGGLLLEIIKNLLRM